MTFVFEGASKAQEVLPVFLHSRRSARAKAHLWADLTEARTHLETTKRIAGQIIDGSTIYTIAENKLELDNFREIAGSCSYVGREGIEFYPQELLLFNYLSNGPKPGTVWVKNIQVQKSKFKIPQQKIILETKYLFPLAKGPRIIPFGYKNPSILVAFPYEAHTPHAPVSKAKLKQLSPFLLQYYEK
jgi:hypothetical protein